MIVYKVTNIVNGKVYIGQTILTLAARKHSHEGSMYQNRRFYSALRKHGKKNFIWEVLSECFDKEQMNELEKFYILQFKSKDPEFGYNMTDGGDSPLGRKHKEESKIKMSISKTGKKLPHTEEWNMKIGAAQIGNKNHMFGKMGCENPTSKEYTITYPNGNKVRIKGLSDFCRQHSLDSSNMSACAGGKRKSHKGFKCYFYMEA